jgi:uncharacterized protein (TIGR04222 family)
MHAEQSLLTTEQRDVWKRLSEFAFDSPAHRRPFSLRLAQEHGWTAAYTQRVLDEYRRFLFLTVAAGHVVCPSDDVDEAWHQHLTFTRSYWQDLCGDVLGRALHHDPSRGGNEEAIRHCTMYAETLESYHRIFGEEAPGDIWPSVDERFDPRSRPRRVDLRKVWIVNRPTWWPGRRRSVAVWTAPVLPLVAAGLGPFDLAGPSFLLFYTALFAISLFVVVLIRRTGRNPESTPDNRELSPAEAACLTHGPAAAVYATLAGLLHDRKLTSRTPKSRFGASRWRDAEFTAAAPLDTPSTSLQQVIHRSAGQAPRKLRELCLAARPVIDGLSHRLMERGLVIDDSQAASSRFTSILILSAVLVTGLVKIGIGVARDRPVTFLGLLCMGVVVSIIVLGRRPWRTAAGDRRVDALKARFGIAKVKLGTDRASAYDIAMCAAIFGAGSLTGQRQEDLKSAWSQSSSGGGCSAGCGSGCGSGCGGGCGGGGCGGCGG